MSMTFGAILDAVCKDGIDATRRADAQEWVRSRHAWIWGAEPWTFKQKTGSITFTANSQVASGPSDVQSVFAVYDANGGALLGIRDLRKFFDDYNTLSNVGSGSPEAYTVVNGQILVGPNGDGSTGLIVYQAKKPSLSADTDVTGLPDGFDLALVHGARAEGYKLTNVPLFQQEDDDFTASVTALANDYLESVLETGGQSGAFRPRAIPAYR